jgi:azurin
MKPYQTIAGAFAIASCLLFAGGCSQQPEQQNQLSDQETKDGWKLLFDGKTMNGWHLYNRGTIPSAWSVDSGKLVCNPHAKNVKHGDLVTDKVYQDFDLKFEWKISKAGNSGLFINVQERPEFVNTFSTGPEYQLLDDNNVEPDYLKNPSHKAAAIFGVVPNNSQTTPKSGEWNQSRILQQDGKLSFWLNGVPTVQVDLNSTEWKTLVAASSLSKFPEFGAAVRGHLAVQDWTNGVAFRNIKIRELGTGGAANQNNPSDQVTTQQSADSIERSVPGVDSMAFSDTLRLQANENMRFDRELFRVRAGKKLRLLFKNTGAPSPTAMAHNVVILKSGVDIADFADLARGAAKDQYIPSGVESLIIAHTKLISGGQSDEVEFTIRQPGVYDFICSYPAHWANMQGKIVAE